MEKRALFSHKLLPYWLLVPQLIITFVFFYWPASQAVWQSFLLQDAFGLSTSFIWFENYRELFIGPLAGGEARELTRSLFAAADVSGEPFIESIVHEAAGSPFLLEQLTHYGMMNERAATAGISLTTMLEERMSQLPAGARQLLHRGLL